MYGVFYVSSGIIEKISCIVVAVKGKETNQQQLRCDGFGRKMHKVYQYIIEKGYI